MSLGPEHFLPSLGKLLLSLFSDRSALAPSIEKRVIMIRVTPSTEEKKASSSLSSELLRKIGAAYNSYRGQLMDVVAHAQPFISQVSYSFQEDLNKLASSSPEQAFSPLSVAYIQSAFLDEVGPQHGSGQNKLAFAGV